MHKAVPVVSCLGSRKKDSMFFICANWPMTYMFTVECMQNHTGVSNQCSHDHMFIFILYISVEPPEMSYAEAEVAQLLRPGT